MHSLSLPCYQRVCWMTSTQLLLLAPPPPQVSYMISAWARMCKIIGQGFVQYLPIVVGPLMQAASIKPEIALVDCEFP